MGGLWHADFHSGSLAVLTRKGKWEIPQLFGGLDDRSRLCCHGQWYLAETAENFAHGLSQGIQKRGVPRALMTDNGGAETAAEVEQGLSRLGITHELILPYSPYQNAKQEVFWALIEGRLVPMLEGVKERPWCTTPIEAESSLGPDSHHPIILLSGIPSAVMVLRILHPDPCLDSLCRQPSRSHC